MKTCSKCRVEKDEAEFSKKKQNKDGLDSRCKSCVREYQQTDSYKEYKKAYQQTDAYKEPLRAYRQTDVYKDSRKAYKQTDAYKEYLRAHRQTDAYKVKNREYMQAYRLRKKAAEGNAGQLGDTIGA